MSNLEQNQDIGIDCLHSLNQRLETGKVLLVDHHLILSGKSVVGNSQGFDDDYPPLSLCKLYISLDGPLGDLATNCIIAFHRLGYKTVLGDAVADLLR